MRVKHLSKTALLKSCVMCGKTATSGNNRPHSLHKTKRTIKPNLQPYLGGWICVRCLRTMKKASK